MNTPSKDDIIAQILEIMARHNLSLADIEEPESASGQQEPDTLMTKSLARRAESHMKAGVPASNQGRVIRRNSTVSGSHGVGIPAPLLLTRLAGKPAGTGS
jgi:hypothetical protein